MGEDLSGAVPVAAGGECRGERGMGSGTLKGSLGAEFGQGALGSLDGRVGVALHEVRPGEFRQDIPAVVAVADVVQIGEGFLQGGACVVGAGRVLVEQEVAVGAEQAGRVAPVGAVPEVGERLLGEFQRLAVPAAFAGDQAGAPQHGGPGARRLHPVRTVEPFAQQALRLPVVAQLEVGRGHGGQQVDGRVRLPAVDLVQPLYRGTADLDHAPQVAQLVQAAAPTDDDAERGKVAGGVHRLLHQTLVRLRRLGQLALALQGTGQADGGLRPQERVEVRGGQRALEVLLGRFGTVCFQRELPVPHGERRRPRLGRLGHAGEFVRRTAEALGEQSHGLRCRIAPAGFQQRHVADRQGSAGQLPLGQAARRPERPEPSRKVMLTELTHVNPPC